MLRTSVNPDLIADQFVFQVTFGYGVLPFPQIPSEHVQERRRMLVTEEFNKEFLTAWEACNNLGRLPKDDPARKELEVEALAELGDALADAIYVLIGTAFEYGIPLAAIWQAVQAANMSKLWTWDEVAPIGVGFTVAPTSTDWFQIPSTAYHIVANGKFQRVLVHPFAGLRYAVYNQHGKVMKPPSWKAPDITGIIRNAIASQATPPDQQANRDKWNKAIADTENQKESAIGHDET